MKLDDLVTRFALALGVCLFLTGCAPNARHDQHDERWPHEQGHDEDDGNGRYGQRA